MNKEILKDFDRGLKEYKQLRTIDRILKLKDELDQLDKIKSGIIDKPIRKTKEKYKLNYNLCVPMKESFKLDSTTTLDTETFIDMTM